MARTPVRLLRNVVRVLSRLYPLYSGCGTLANSAPYRFLSREPDLVEARLRDRSSIRVHLNDYVGRSLYFFGDLDPKISWLCRAVLRPGDTAIDVGANYGLVALQAARVVGATGSVHAFEPQGDLAAMLRSSCDRNGYRHAAVHERGLSDADADVNMTVPTHNRGMGAVNAGWLSGRTVPIRLKNGSDFLRGLKLAKVRLMKVDVEGHEAAVFAGAREWLAEALPEVIVFETAEPRPLCEHAGAKVLAGLGYDFFGIPGARLRMRLHPVPASGTAHFHDVVAVQRGSSFDARAA